MQLKIRKLSNGKFVVEAKRWFDIKWHGARIDRTLTTRGAANSGVTSIPRIVIEPAGTMNYSLAWHDTEGSAKTALIEAMSILGK
jgi:hypothetical protein